MAVAVQDIDRGWGRIVKSLVEMNGKEIAVGIMAGEKAADGKTDLAAIGAYNEFGTERIPERSFLRSTFDAKNDQWHAMAQAGAGAIVDGRETVDDLLKTLGQVMEGDVKRKIGDGPFTPNAPGTILAKKSDTPLIDTGRMRQSIRAVVRKRGSGGLINE